MHGKSEGNEPKWNMPPFQSDYAHEKLQGGEHQLHGGPGQWDWNDTKWHWNDTQCHGGA